MQSRNLLFLFFALIFTRAVQAQGAEYIEACGKHITPTQISLNSDEIAQLSILTLMASSASDDVSLSSKFSGLISGGFFDGTLNGARSKKSALEKRLNLNYSREQSIGYLAKYMSPEGGSAFAACVQSVFNSPGLHISLQDLDGSGVNVRAKYKAQDGETRSLAFGIETDGVTTWRQKLDLAPSGGSRDFLVYRSNPAKELHVKVEVIADNTVIASGLMFVPVQSKVKLKRTALDPQKSAESSVVCGGYRDGATKFGTVVELVPSRIGGVLHSIKREAKLAGGRLGIQPGNGSGMEIVTETASKISARAVCVPGNNTDDTYSVTGYIAAQEYIEEAEVQTPADNGVTPVSRRVSMCRWWTFLADGCSL